MTFGTYPQSEDGSDRTPIEWIVLDRVEGKALLLSKKGLDARKYDDVKLYVRVEWAECSLRKWLNKEFINLAFSRTEQKGILLTDVDNSASQGEYDEGSGNTRDKVFLLSYYEAVKYLNLGNDNANTQLEVTSYARKKVRGGSWWWLRSPAGSRGRSSMIRSDGDSNTCYVYDIGHIRPALWINLDSGIF